MSELEELHELIEIAAEDVCYNSEGYGPSSLAHAVAADAANAVLAAGYRKPRTITTAEELDGLADCSVVMESQPDAFAGINVMAGVFHKFPHTGWQCVASYKCYGPAEIELPATVLYEPTA